MPDYTDNPLKAQEKKKAKPEKEVVEKVVVGVVVQKPKSLGRKFKDIFLGGDAKQAAGYVGRDVLLPALRNLIVDMVTKGAERLVYGESMRGRRPGGIDYSARYRGGVQYNRPLDPRDPRERSPLAPPRIRQNRHDMNDVVLSSKEEAELVIERLADILDKYDVVSLADLYDLLGLQTSHVDNKWGWTDLRGVTVRQIRTGYLLELPVLDEI